MSDGNSNERKGERLMSIDMLRGMDMFLITGGGAVLTALAGYIWGDQVPETIKYHLNHVNWEGFAAWDLIMPLFIFIVGASIPFAFAKFKSGALSQGAVYKRIISRFLILNIFGMISQGNLLHFKWENFIFISDTLQAIAFGYLIASLLYIHGTWRIRGISVFAFMLLYSLIILLVPFNGQEAGTLELKNNIALFVESCVFGAHQGGGFYAWVLPIFSFGALTVAGCLCGEWLRSSCSGNRKALGLMLVGLALLCVGYGESFMIPIVKRIFSPSMTLWAMGWSVLLMGLFYYIIDVRGWGHKLLFPFQVIGSNAIFVYMWMAISPPQYSISKALFGGLSSHFGEAQHLVFMSCNYLFVWYVLYFLFKHKIFIKV